ncbi:MAG: Hsp70 family protein [Desulfomonilaceae bacterium]|nr:Hsp70 family protein [Desulfomonilaceae bacterium]
MAGRLAVDFGTSNTRVAVWDEALDEAGTVAVPDVSVTARYEDSERRTIEVPYVPSLVAYEGTRMWIGKQVADKGLLESGTTFRWMKRYISNRLEIPRKVDGRAVKISEAGSDFLTRVLVYAAEFIDLGDEEVAFTVPVEAFEHYQDWLIGVCEAAGIPRYRLIDEASAAALGYGVKLKAGDTYMVFDFGGGTLDVSIVRMESTSVGGRRCTVLGKGGAEIGGATIDKWLYRDFLEKNGKAPEDIRHVSGLLLLEVERAKETLTASDRADIVVADPDTGEVFSAHYSRSAFEDLLEENGLFETVHAVMNRALSDAGERGYEGDRIAEVLLVGGSSLIPSVRRAVRQVFGRRVSSHRPLDAVVLGAAAFVHGVDFYDHVQHEYALRYYDRETGEHDYLRIVPSGTPYPTDGPILDVMVSASYDDQEFLGLDIYEIGRKECFSCGEGPQLDLVFDPSGAARFQERQEPEVMSRFWMNEKCPTFIEARPKARRGDKRFPVQFSVDGNKRLCVTVRDKRSGKVLFDRHPLVKLT